MQVSSSCVTQTEPRGLPLVSTVSPGLHFNAAKPWSRLSPFAWVCSLHELIAFYFFCGVGGWALCLLAYGFLVPVWTKIEPGPWQWSSQVLTTGQPELPGRPVLLYGSQQVTSSPDLSLGQICLGGGMPASPWEMWLGEGGTSCKRNSLVFVLLWLTNFLWHDVFRVHPRCGRCQTPFLVKVG